jgi:hypothetical protein
MYLRVLERLLSDSIWSTLPLAMCGNRWVELSVYAFTLEQTCVMKWISSLVSFTERLVGRVNILSLSFVKGIMVVKFALDLIIVA